MEINTDVIKELISSLKKADFDSLNLETSDFKLKIERGNHAQNVTVTAPAAANVAVAQKACDSKEGDKEKKEEAKGTIVKSPIVGTFYTSPSPDKPAFVAVGKRVKCGDTLYIVESMKLMNEVASEYDGTVAEIFVKNGDTVEYGQPIMRIE